MLYVYGRDDPEGDIGRLVTANPQSPRLDEPEHGSATTHMETRGCGDRDGFTSVWVITGEMWDHRCIFATHCALSRAPRQWTAMRACIHLFSLVRQRPMALRSRYMWTFSMPTDHRSCYQRLVPDDALFGDVGRGLSLAQCFVTRTGSAARARWSPPSIA